MRDIFPLPTGTEALPTGVTHSNPLRLDVLGTVSAKLAQTNNIWIQTWPL
jgi:hypothetical protein